MLVGVRHPALSIVLLVTTVMLGVAAAEPVSFALQGQVGAGQKPQLMVTASEKVTDLRLDVERSDGKKFSGRHPALEKDETVSLPIGDGATGKASYKGTLSMATAGGKRWTEKLTFDTSVGGGSLKVAYDADHLDLDKRVLQF
jgi:hypothetical protein